MGDAAITDLKDKLKGLLDLFHEWLFAALHPVAACKSLLATTDEAERLRRALKLWVVSFVVSVGVFFPLYHQYGIGLGSFEFHLSVILYLTLGMIACGFAIQFGLRIYGIRATFSDLMAVYTAFVMCYQPFVNLLCYFAYIRFFALLGAAKGQGLDLGQTMGLFVSQSVSLAERQDLLFIGSKVGSWVLFAVSCVSSSFMAATVAERCSVSRVKSFSAFAFTMATLVPPIAVVQGFLVAYAEYAFISVHGTGALSR